MANNLKIQNLKARVILDSKKKSTVEVKLKTNKGVFLASCPSGTSTGKNEAQAIDAKKAVKNINKIIKPVLLGKNLPRQAKIDRTLIKLDGTKKKRRLGANAILTVSIAALRARAKEKNLPLWKYVARVARTRPDLPKPSILLIEGGLHGKTKLDIQEFMVVPEGKSFSEQFLKGKKIYQKLKKILSKKFGKRGTTIGLEGAFTPPISDLEEVLDYIVKAAGKHGFKVGLDCAISHQKQGKYNIDFYRDLIKKYPILFLEDPFGEEDWQNWRNLHRQRGMSSLAGGEILIVGDDLTVTNSARIKLARQKGACNAVIIKPNQIGTVTETIEAVKLAKSFGWKIIVSHRSGETMDDFIADLAVGLGADFIKTGAPFTPERMAKYNRLLKIEKEI